MAQTPVTVFHVELIWQTHPRQNRDHTTQSTALMVRVPFSASRRHHIHHILCRARFGERESRYPNSRTYLRTQRELSSRTLTQRTNRRDQLPYLPCRSTIHTGLCLSSSSKPYSFLPERPHRPRPLCVNTTSQSAERNNLPTHIQR